MSAATTGRTVLVIGAAGGMARGINARFAKAGHTVLCIDFDAEGAQCAADAITADGGEATAFQVDISDAASIRRLGRDVEAAGYSVEVILNAAGILDRRYLADHDDDSFDRAIQINLVGPFRIIQELDRKSVV